MQKTAALFFSRLPVLAAIMFFTMAIGVGLQWHGSLPAAFKALHVDSTSPDFADTRTVTYSIDCLLSGHDPYIVRSFDPWNRLYNYPPIWLSLRHFGVTSQSTDLMAGILAGMFAIALLFLFEVRTWAGAVLTFLGVFSRPVLFAIERGNTDLAIFSLMVFGFLLIKRQRGEEKLFSQSLLIILLVILKIFPVAAVAVFIRNRKGLLVSFGVAVLSLVALVITSGSKLPLVLANTPQDRYYSYGSYPLLAGLNAHLPTILSINVDRLHAVAPVAAIVLAGLSVILGMRFREKLSNFLPALDFESGMGCIAVSGLAIYCFTFIRGSSYEYRLIFLLGALAYLVNGLNLGIRSRALPASVVLVLFYVARWGTHPFVGEVLDGIVFFGACAWLGTALLTHLQKAAPGSLPDEGYLLQPLAK